METNDDTHPADLADLDALQSELRNAVYLATAPFEDAERKRLTFGNGHHLRQLVSDFASDVARARWLSSAGAAQAARRPPYAYSIAATIRSIDDPLQVAEDGLFVCDAQERGDRAVAGQAWAFYMRTGRAATVEDAAEMADALEREGKSGEGFGVDMADMELCKVSKDGRVRIGLQPTREAMRRAIAERQG